MVLKIEPTGELLSWQFQSFLSEFQFEAISRKILDIHHEHSLRPIKSLDLEPVLHVFTLC